MNAQSTSSQIESTASPGGLITALGFGTTVAMWGIGYVCMTSPGLVIGEILFVVELLTLVVGGYFTGRILRSIRSGIYVGIVSATVNLLIVGSLMRRGEDGSIFASALIWITGLYGASILLCAIGAAFGKRATKLQKPPHATGLFSAIAAATVFLLLITGGLVTGLEEGLAVPDWPNSFGHNMLLYPLAEMSGGVYYEHAHRLYGMLVGLTTLTLMITIYLQDSRVWIRALVSAIFVMVCIQGLMGGLRVTGEFTMSQENTRPSVVFAIMHGVFGQVVFASFCWLAVGSSTTWKNSRNLIGTEPGDRDRLVTKLLVAALIIQLVLGALYRHLQIPATETTPTHHPMLPLIGHISFSVVVLLMTIYTGTRMSQRNSTPMVKFFGQSILVLVCFQFLLGVIAFIAIIMRVNEIIPMWELISTSSHQANGALLLGVSVALAALVQRSVTSSLDGQPLEDPQASVA